MNCVLRNGIGAGALLHFNASQGDPADRLPTHIANRVAGNGGTWPGNENSEHLVGADQRVCNRPTSNCSTNGVISNGGRLTRISDDENSPEPSDRPCALDGNGTDVVIGNRIA